MVKALLHRGPDEQRVVSDGIATLGTARLSILDRPGGSQPMSVDRHTIAYNGEIYNTGELRGKLESRMEFRSRCDTEVVLAAHAICGASAVQELDGMFAYAIWNGAELLLVRDRLGIKPLFYAQIEGAFLFASEPKALLATGLVANEHDRSAMLEYFLHGSAFASGYVTGERSFFRHIRAVAAGHFVRWTSAGVSSQRYWRPLDEFADVSFSEQEAVDILREAVEDSVQRTMVADVPVGSALSGGLDSSILTALAARLAPGLRSSSITFRDDHGDPDAAHAALLSDFLNRERLGSHGLSFAYLSEQNYLDGLDDLVRSFDEPHWELRQLGMRANYRQLAADGMIVVLTGEGADELFFGYYQRFPGFRTPPLDSPGQFAWHWLRRSPWVEKLLEPSFPSLKAARTEIAGIAESAIDRDLRPYWEASGSRLRAVQCWYLHTFLPWLLTVNDRSSMAFSLEGRFPFLTRNLVRLALRFPPEWNIATDSGLSEKTMLRRAFREALPPEIWRDRRKAPLPVPQRATFHRLIWSRLNDEVEQRANPIWDLLNRSVVCRMLAEYGERLVQAESLGDGAGEHLTQYLPLDADMSVRSAHLFSILTCARWYTEAR